MNHKLRTIISILALASVALGGLLPATAQPPTNAAVPTPSSSLLFIENAGQFAEGARFQVRGASQGTVWLAQDAIWLTTVEPAAEAPAHSPFMPESGEPDVGGVPHHGVAIKLSFIDANPQPRLEPFNRLDTHVSYFLGSDPAGWHADVPVWGGVRYVNLYPGIDLELAGEASRMVPRLVARPGADLSAVRLRVEGVDGVTLENGMLRLSSAAGEVSWPLMQVEGTTSEAAILGQGMGTFEVAAPFTAQERYPIPQAVVSPNDTPAALLYSTFLGSSRDELAHNIAVDGSGAAYVTGETYSSDFPTSPGAFDTSYNGGYWDAFVVKLNLAGSALDYATFLGGGDDDLGHAIAVDGNRAVYVTGATKSSDFPTTLGAFDTTYNDEQDAFLIKLNATGSVLDYGTFLGGLDEEMGMDIVVDSGGSAYVTGWTDSSDFPVTPGAFDTFFDGGYAYRTTFVIKLDAIGSALAYATFLGGSRSDVGYGIAVDGSGAAYVTGYTTWSDFPATPGSLDTSYNGLYSDAFVAKLNATGSALNYGTYLGGSGGSSEWGFDIAVDGSGAAYVTGNTLSSDFPTTPGAYDTTYNGHGENEDAFVAKLNAAGSALDYGTYLGGSDGNDVGYAITVDGNGSAYIIGTTVSSYFPTTCLAFDSSYNDDEIGPSSDAFVAKLNTAGSVLVYSTYLGGSEPDESTGIAVDGSGVVYVTGGTLSPNFPTVPGAFDTSYGGGTSGYYGDAFVVKLAMDTCIYIQLPLVIRSH